jgi:putative SOS response-associated peptidase YedK
MINARSETAAEKPAYRAAFSHRRCIVPADGFYEWRRVGDEKTPYFISLESGEPFAIAALWERWVDKDTGEELQTATLLTTAANEFMSRLHDRMPVILDPAAADGWLDGSAVDVADGTAPPALRAWPVRRRVNNARNEGSDLIEADSGTVAD